MQDDLCVCGDDLCVLRDDLCVTTAYTAVVAFLVYHLHMQITTTRVPCLCHAHLPVCTPTFHTPHHTAHTYAPHTTQHTHTHILPTPHSTHTYSPNHTTHPLSPHHTTNTGLYDTTALPIPPPHTPPPNAPHLLFMVLLTCVYNVDHLGDLVPEHSKQPDAGGVMAGLALVLRHLGSTASEVG